MAKFKYIKPRKLNYKGEQYLQGTILEMKEFDNQLPRDWFEEIKEVEKKEIVENKKTKGVGK